VAAGDVAAAVAESRSAEILPAGIITDTNAKETDPAVRTTADAEKKGKLARRMSVTASVRDERGRAAISPV